MFCCIKVIAEIKAIRETIMILIFLDKIDQEQQKKNYSMILSFLKTSKRVGKLYPLTGEHLILIKNISMFRELFHLFN